MDEHRRRLAGIISGLDVHYDLGEGHPLLGRRMPDLDLVTADGPLRAYELLHGAKPVLLNLGEPDGIDITPWADRVQLIDADYVGLRELPVLGVVNAPTAVLVRPDGYVAWVGDGTNVGLTDALATWFEPPTAAQRTAAVDPAVTRPPPSMLARAQMRVVHQRICNAPAHRQSRASAARQLQATVCHLGDPPRRAWPRSGLVAIVRTVRRGSR